MSVGQSTDAIDTSFRRREARSAERERPLDGLMHYDCSAFMKTALLPATRVAPALRKRVEDLLEEGETVSSFVEAAVTQHADARASQREFIKRGLAAEQEGDWVTPAAVFKAVREAASRGKRKARG